MKDQTLGVWVWEQEAYAKCIQIHKQTAVRIYMCGYKYIYIYTHTHTHTHISCAHPHASLQFQGLSKLKALKPINNGIPLYPIQPIKSALPLMLPGSLLQSSLRQRAPPLLSKVVSKGSAMVGRPSPIRRILPCFPLPSLYTWNPILTD